MHEGKAKQLECSNLDIPQFTLNLNPLKIFLNLQSHYLSQDGRKLLWSKILHPNPWVIRKDEWPWALAVPSPADLHDN